MKIPVNGNWTVDQSSDRGVGLLATKNIHFDARGLATLANRTIALFDESDDASFTGAIAVYSNPDLVKLVGTGNTPYTININSLPFSISADAAGSQPAGSIEGSQAYFNQKWRVTENADMKSFDGSSWTDETLSPSLTSTKRHPLCVHKGNNSLLIGNGPKVEQYDTSLANTVSLALPDTGAVEVVGIAYNRSLSAVITWDPNNLEAWLYIWDGATAAANYSYPLGSNRAFFIAPYLDTFVTMNGAGELLTWTSSGLEPLAALPIFYTSADLASINTRQDGAHDTGILVDRKRILLGVNAYAAFKGSEPSVYNPLMPGGIWCFDKQVGLYHRHAPSTAKLLRRLCTSPNLSTNVCTVAATVPETGTPLLHIGHNGGAAIGGLVANEIYYTIKVSSTTFKIAASRADAAAGTAIDLTTDTDPSNEYDFLWFPESDFGQLSSNMYAEIIVKTGPQKFNLLASAFTIFQKYAFAFKDVDGLSYASPIDIFGVVMDRGENRGWMLTQKLYSGGVTDKFQKLYVKVRNLVTADDKVIVKFRSQEDPDFPIYATRDGLTYGTWVTSTQFTTTADLSPAKTAFDAGKKYEIEILNGAGAGYLAHISGISLAAGTYTVDIDETIRNISASDTFNFIVHNFIKLQTKTGDGQMDSSSDPDYGEFAISDGSKWGQFRIELRGHGVAIEELEPVNSGEKGAV